MNIKLLEKFWNWLRTDYPRDSYTEIKLMNIEDDRLYKQVQCFQEEHDIVIRKNCQFFIKEFKDLWQILNYKAGIFDKYSKICYSISPKFFDEKGDISGKYDHMKIADMIFLDIEKIEHSSLTEEDEPFIKQFINNVMDRLRQYGLTKPVVVHSGGGYHLLYKVKRMKFDKGRKLGYKQFISELEFLNSKLYKIDHCVDLSRCIGLPETFNNKRGKKVTIIGPIPKEPIDDYYIKSKRMDLIKKLEKQLKGRKIDTGSNEYFAGYVDGWNDREAKVKHSESDWEELMSEEDRKLR